MEKKIKAPLYIFHSGPTTHIYIYIYILFHLHAVGKGHQSHQKKKKKKKERDTDFINSELDAVWWGVVL